MNEHTSLLQWTHHARRWAHGLVAGTALAVLVACGGGADSSDTTAPDTTAAAYTRGVITGFGSVIVNGVRFDDSSASVVDDSGQAVSRSVLKLGVQVEVEASALDHSNATGRATVFRVGGPGLQGPVEAVDSSASTLTVLGQTVEVTVTTVFDTSLSGGLSALAVGDVLEIHALYDSARALYVASRIEPASDTSSYRLAGTVANLDTTAQTFSLGGAVINYASATTVPTTLADGLAVKVKLQTTAVDGQWLATEVRSKSDKPKNHHDAGVRGLITAWTSATSFSVDGLVVDAAAATFPDGQDGVVLGAEVEVKGAIVDGVLVATLVHLEDHSHHGHGEDFELHGLLSGLDTSAKTFVLRGQNVSYASVSEWRKMTEADLVEGLAVEVKGSLSADGTQLIASRIQREH